MIKPSSVSPVSPDVGSEVRFQAYISALCEEIGHADRIAPLRSYCTGLLLPGERKSIEPMAARLDPRHVQATHQSLHHFVAKAPWDRDRVPNGYTVLVDQHFLDQQAEDLLAPGDVETFSRLAQTFQKASQGFTQPQHRSLLGCPIPQGL